MDWRGRRTSRNVEDRRGMRMTGGRGLGIGATVAILLIGAFLGVDVTPFLNGTGSVTTAPAPTGPNRIDDDQEAFVATILAETEQAWGEIFTASRLEYREPSLVLFSGGTTSACGMADAAMGPFYCPGDRKVYLDMDFFRVMEQQLQAGGDFANAYVIAHEIGHHVQNELGTLGEVNTRRQRVGQAESNALSVRIELQADCYAGVWAHAASGRLRVTDDDIRQALATAARIGDDALQRAAGGRVVPDSFTHGTSDQRQRWFFQGYRSGDPNQCDTFGAGRL
ncbi:KPN_02809 family neutral zinc metallopeptidase [Ruixingdingia sedimenti]|nr:neutral zinc metallopeptidase [Xinfangfangia sp. LG-4]